MRSALVFGLILGCASSPGAATDASQPLVTDASIADVSATDAPSVEDVVEAPWRCVRNPARPVPSPARCNGSASRCGRRLDQVVFPTTHNAMATREERFSAANQRHTMRRQMDDGVRGLMLDAHRWMGDVWLCHGACAVGARRLAEGLCDIGQFLDAHPEEVLVLILESYINGAELEGAMREAGMLDALHVQREGEAWPTLGAMIASGRRVVVLDDSADPTRPWDLPVWRFAQETPFSAERPADLDCRMNRGSSNNGLFILNHFLTAPIAFESLAEQVNHNPFLVERARRCRRERGRLPNFVTVDFYEIGDLFAASESLDAEAAAAQ